MTPRELFEQALQGGFADYDMVVRDNAGGRNVFPEYWLNHEAGYIEFE